MTSRPSTTAFELDDAGDRTNASNGTSRYQSYLWDRRRDFYTDSTAMDFLMEAFTTATGPIMSPGYVREHDRVVDVKFHADDDRQFALRVGFAIPTPREIGAVLCGRSWMGWDRWDAGRFAEPWDNDRPAAYLTLTVSVPLQADKFPAPKFGGLDRTPDVATAKASLAELCRQVNPVCRPLLAAYNTSAV